MHGFNTQTAEGDYRIQFQTDSRDEWLLVQQLCRDIMDGKKLSQPPRWTPVSERLPKKSGKYYVSGRGKIWICEYLIIPNFTSGWCNDALNPIVQAWMPLPELYKEEER